MFLGFCALMLLGAVPLLGGDLRRIGTIRLRLGWLVFAALVVQVIVISLTPNGNRTVQAVAHVLTYVAALVVVAANRHLPGVLVIGAGTFTNALAIAVNGGTLPASSSAQAAAGLHKLGGGLDNSAALPHPRLAWLGDQFVSPGFLPFHNVVSIGDLLILMGAAVLVWRVSGVNIGSILRRHRRAQAVSER